MTFAVRAERLARTYSGTNGPVHALLPSDLTVRRGEVVAIGGPSGGGKSTLLNLLGLLDRPTEGALWIAGNRIDGLDQRGFSDARRQHIGFLFQDAGLVDRMTAFNNVRLPLEYRRLTDGESRERAQLALDAVGLSHRRAALVDTLSGGERQRVGLARLLAVQPRVIVCDEPTASLDESNSRAVVAHLREAANNGACVICASHDPIVTEAADRRLTLSRGLLCSERPQ